MSSVYSDICMRRQQFSGYVGPASVIVHHASIGSHRLACRAGGKSVDDEILLHVYQTTHFKRVRQVDYIRVRLTPNESERLFWKNAKAAASFC